MLVAKGGKNYCKFYLQGYCKNAANCAFIHERPKCHFFSKGMCFRGNLCYFVHGEPEHRDASLMIKELDEIGPLPFKFAPPTSSEKLQKEGLVRKLNGIKKCDYDTNEYYDAFVEVLENYYLYEITRDDMLDVLVQLEEQDKVNIHKYVLPSLFNNWCISCRHWADFILTFVCGTELPPEEEQIITALNDLTCDDQVVMRGTAVVGFLTLDKPALANSIFKSFPEEEHSIHLKILAAYLQPQVIAMFLNKAIQHYKTRDDEYCRCQTYQCRCPLKIDHSQAADIVDTITELTEWSDFQKRDFVKVICHSLFKRPEVQEVAESLRFENDMVRAEAVCDTLAKPLTDVEKIHLRRVFHRAFGIHPRAINYYLSQEEPTRRRQTILKLGIDPNELLSAGEVWIGPNKPEDVVKKEGRMEIDALETDKCQSPLLDCKNRPKDVCDRGLCRRCCVEYGKKNGTDCHGHMLFFTEGDFSDSEQDSSCDKRRDLGLVPRINFPYFKPRVTLYGAPNLEEAIKSKCRYQRIDFDGQFHLEDEHLIKLIDRFSVDLRCLALGSKETRAGMKLTVASLSQISKCRNLHKLSLECAIHCDNETLHQIITGCPKLKYLEVSGCHKHSGSLTDAAIEPLFNQTHQLQYLNLEFQREIGGEVLSRLKRRRPALVTCDIYTNEKRTQDNQMQHMLRQLTELTPSEGGEIISSDMSESSEGSERDGETAAEKMSREADEVIKKFSPDPFSGKGIPQGSNNMPRLRPTHLTGIDEGEEEERPNGIGGMCGYTGTEKQWEPEAEGTEAVLNGEWVD